MAEPEVITMMRDLVANPDRRFCTVATDGPFPKLGIRPELLSANPNNDTRVWSINRRQAAKVLTLWDEAIANLSEPYDC